MTSCEKILDVIKNLLRQTYYFIGFCNFPPTNYINHRNIINTINITDKNVIDKIIR